MKFSSDSVINFSPEAKDPGQSDPDSDRSEYNLKLFVGLYLFLLTLQWDMQKKQPLAPGGSGATGDNLRLCCGGGQTLRDTYILPHMHSQPHPLITTYVCPCASTAAISKHATSCFSQTIVGHSQIIVWQTCGQLAKQVHMSVTVTSVITEGFRSTDKRGQGELINIIFPTSTISQANNQRRG